MAKKNKEEHISLSFGVISLPVMACVLAAVLFASERDTTRQPDSEDEATLNRTESEVQETRKQLDLVKTKVEYAVSIVNDKLRLEKELQRIQVELARLHKEREILANNVTEAQEKAALLGKITNVSKQIYALSNSVAQILEQKRAIANRIELAGMNEFPRPYISIECVKDTATVYAPKQSARSLRPPLSSKEREWLDAQLATNKAVVVFARTSSFAACYPAFYSVVLDIQDKWERKNVDIAVGLIPIQDYEDIRGHILYGGTE